MVGCVIGSTDARRHRQRLLRQHALHLLGCLAPRLVAAPPLGWRLAGYAAPYRACLRQRGPQTPASPTADALPDASLFLLAVASSHRRQGIATHLVGVFLDELARRGSDRVKLSVAEKQAGEPALVTAIRQAVGQGTP